MTVGRFRASHWLTLRENYRLKQFAFLNLELSLFQLANAGQLVNFLFCIRGLLSKDSCHYQLNIPHFCLSFSSTGNEFRDINLYVFNF